MECIPSPVCQPGAIMNSQIADGRWHETAGRAPEAVAQVRSLPGGTLRGGTKRAGQTGSATLSEAQEIRRAEQAMARCITEGHTVEE
jgi:hypothetical protein